MPRVDIPVLTQITGDMVEVMHASLADAPPNGASSVEDVVGQYAALPILAGQYVDRRGA